MAAMLTSQQKVWILRDHLALVDTVFLDRFSATQAGLLICNAVWAGYIGRTWRFDEWAPLGNARMSVRGGGTWADVSLIEKPLVQ